MNEQPTINKLLDELTDVRGQVRALQEQERDLKRRQSDIEISLVSQLENQGVDRVGNNACTVSIKKEIVPTVEDWDQVHQHIIDTKQFELLQKRMSSVAFRELLTMGMNVPGVKPTELTRINFRSK
jgi:hypothetical protein